MLSAVGYSPSTCFRVTRDMQEEHSYQLALSRWSVNFPHTGQVRPRAMAILLKSLAR